MKQQDGKQVVSARELYEKLGFNMTHWAKWCKTNITNNDFAPVDVDYQSLRTEGENSIGRPTEDFAISMTFAKKLSMQAKTKVGERVRDYFLEMEQKELNPSISVKPTLFSWRQIVELVIEKRIGLIEVSLYRPA